MNGRITSPTDDPIVARLRTGPQSPDAEDVVALVGYVCPGRSGAIRIHPDPNLQRWLEVPAVVDSQRIDPDDELSRSVIWVDREMMMEEIFADAEGANDGRLANVAEVLAEVPFSTWNLIPETRLEAARLLELRPHGPDQGVYP